MEEGHRPLWRHFIQAIPETGLSTCQVLDFGCNRGGFLRLLYALKPFRRALGVDIAHESITAARDLSGRGWKRPLCFHSVSCKSIQSRGMCPEVWLSIRAFTPAPN
jgi:SAM-dependent methyltransferase